MPRIETERLFLEPYAETDLDAIHALWTSPGVRRYLFDNEIIPVDFVRAEIESNARSFEQYGWGQWKAVLKDGESLAGFCGFREFHEPPQLELLFGVGEPWWGRGLAVEMARAMIALGFSLWGFERVQGSTDTPNEASIRVMEKLGMREIRREVTNGLDTAYFEITPPEFNAGDQTLNYDGEPLRFGS